MPEVMHVDEITAKSLKLVDDDGNVFLSAGSVGGNSGLWLVNPKRPGRILGLFHQGEASAIGIYAGINSSIPEVALVDDDRGFRLQFADGKGVITVSIDEIKRLLGHS